MADLKEWVNHRAEADRRLYEQYGKPLESSHRDEFVAIGDDGRTILGQTDVDVLEKAIETFGSGKFAFRRLGHRTMGRWLNLPK